MSSETAGRFSVPAPDRQREPVAIPIRGDQRPADDCLEFVRFCYRRRRVSWPALYDEMAAVAARGTFRGLGFAELAERGVCFSLNDLPRLAALTAQVMREEGRTVERSEERREDGGAALRFAPARG